MFPSSPPLGGESGAGFYVLLGNEVLPYFHLTVIREIFIEHLVCGGCYCKCLGHICEQGTQMVALEELMPQ